MTDISSIDKNFATPKTIIKEGVKFYNPLKAPFVISGVKYIDGLFYRMHPEVADKVSDGVRYLNTNTAGGRIRFKTDSDYVALCVKYTNTGKMPHFAFSGSIGFDLYADGVYFGTFMPSVDITDTLEGIVYIGNNGLREITINFPLYSSVSAVSVGVDENASVLAPTPYINDKPIVYYGSSITQGGCASRPGMAYQAIISRKLNVDFINLGFSGSAKAEDAMIDYISGLDMSLFVYDYDHNAPTLEHLKNTHEKMYLSVRKTHPNIPIIMMTRPKKVRSDEENQRIEVVRKTYQNAISRGENVYMLDGDDLTALCGCEGTVDNTHPTDFGFLSMANALIDLFNKEGLIKFVK